MSGDACITHRVGEFEVQENGIVNRASDGHYIGRLHEIEQLRDFAIWMTGCGYDFCQHPHFIEQRDKLLKA